MSQLLWTSVINSREVSKVAYEAEAKTIHVRFLKSRKDGGIWYRYHNCNEELWRRFLEARSKGRFVLDILNQYPFDTYDADGNFLSRSAPRDEA